MKSINREIKTYFETNEIQYAKTYGAKVVLKGKLEEISTYFKKQKQFQSGLMSQAERQNNKIFREKYFYDTRQRIYWERQKSYN